MATTNVGDYEYETPEDTYWGKRLRQFVKANPNEGLEKTKEALCNDSAAWGVFAALLMTVGAAALTISKSDFVGESLPFVSTAYVATNAISFSLSFIAVIVGTQQYSYYNNVPSALIDRAIARNKQMSVTWMVYCAVIAQGIGITAGVNLLFEFEDYAGMIVGVLGLCLLAYVYYLRRKSDQNLKL
eukprot:219656_1